MGVLQTQAVVTDIVSEFNGSGTVGPFTLFDVGGITSGQIYDKITEANSYLQGWVDTGVTSAAAGGDALAKEQVKRFEVVYGAARLGMDILGIITTDGFNYSLAGTSVQRFGPKLQTYTKFVDDHLMVAKKQIEFMMTWFYPYTATNAEGTDNLGNPLSYWRTAPPRY